MALVPFSGELDGEASNLVPFTGELDDPAKAPKQNTSLAGDIGTGLKRGVLQMPGMITGLADLATTPISLATGVNRPISKAADWAGEKTGFQPRKWAEDAAAEYSPEMQQAQANVEAAQGFFPTLGAVAENPRVAAQLVAESLPSTIAGGVLARGAMGMVAGAEKLAALRAAAGSADAVVANAAKAQLLKAGAIAGGIGEGAVTAGQQMSQTGYEVDPALAAGTALAAGVGTGLIGAGSGRLANSAIGKRLGLSDLETSMAAGTLGENTGKAGLASYAKRIGAGIIQEGLLEEAPQSYQEQVWQNLASGKPWDEGAASAAAQGAIAGGLMGGAVNAVPRKPEAPLPPAPEVPPAIPDPSTGGTFTPDPNGGVLERGLSAMANAQAEVDVLAPRAIDTVDRGLELVAPPTAPNSIPDSELPIVGQPAPVPVEPQSIVSGNETGNRTGSAYGDALAKQQRGELLTASDVTALKYPPSDVEIPTEPSTTKKNQSIEPVTRRVDMALPPAVTQQQLDDQEANRSMPRASEQLFTEDAPVFTDQPTQGASNGQEETPQEVLAPQAPAAGASSTTQGTTNGTTPTETQQAETQGQAKQPAAPVARPAALPNHPAAKVVAKALPEAQDVQIHSTDSLSSETTSGSSGRMSKWRGKTIERMAKVFGRKKVVFFSSANTTADGMNIGGGDTLYVNIDAGVDPIAVVGHEWRHALKTSNAAAHAAINQAATKLLEQPGRLLEFAKAYHGTELQQDVVKERIARIEAGEATDEDKAFLAEEFSADMTGNLWRDPKALKEVFDTIMEQHPPSAARTIIKSIGDAILKLIDKLIISTPKGQYSEMGISRDELLGLKKEIQGAMADSFKQDVQRRLDKVRAGQGNGEVKFASARADFTNQTLPTRWPTSKKLDPAPTVKDDMITDMATLKRDPVQYEKAVSAVLQDPGMRSPEMAKGTVDEKAEKIIERMKENLLWLHDQIPEAIRERSKLWYDGARKIAEAWADRYEISESQAAGALAVLSPQKDWFMNVTMAERVLDIIHTKMEHKFDKRMDAAAFGFLTKDSVKTDPDSQKNLKAYVAVKGKTLKKVAAHNDLRQMSVWIRAYDEAYHDAKHAIVTPEGGFVEDKTTKGGDATLRAWGDFNTPGKAASIYLDGTPENINKMLGAEHKVRNFYNNIYAPKDPRFLTADTHAVAANELRPLAGADKPVAENFGKTGGTNLTGLSGTYALHYEAYRRAAEARGLLPREMQSITWEAVRGLFTEGYKGKKENIAAIDKIWSQVDDGELSVDDARQRIIGHAGGIENPDWWNEGNAQYKEVLRDKTYDPKRSNFAGAKVTFEVAPDPRNKALKARWDALPGSDKAEISHKVAWKIAAKALAQFGDENMKGELHEQLGGWLADTNPSLSIWFNKRAAATKINELARILGYALNQMGMMRTSPRSFKTTTGEKAQQFGAVIVEIPADFSAEQTHALYTEIRTITGKRNKPFVSGHTTSAGAMIILNNEAWSGISNEDLTQRIGDRLFGRHKVHLDTIYAEFPAKGKDNYGLRPKSKEDIGDSAESSLRARSDQLRLESGVLLDQLIGEVEQRGIKLSPARSDGAGSGSVREAGPRVSYGSPKEGSSQVEGLHFSQDKRDILDSTRYGQGLPGAEGQRLGRDSTTPEQKQRIHFYVNEGKGVTAESGVGYQAHAVKLNNLYDWKADALGLFDEAIQKFNNYDDQVNYVEQQAMARGFDGVYARGAQGDQGVAVLLGPHTVPVDYLGMGKQTTEVAPPMAPKSEGKQAFEKLQQAVMDNKSLPGGEMAGADWKRMMPKLMPEIDVSHLADDQKYYKDGLVKRPAAEVKRSQPRLNSQGEPIHSTETGLRNFWKWFGNGKLVDEQGRPLVLYRGDSHYETPTSFPIAKTRERGIFLTDDETIAKEYTGRSGNSPQALYVRGDKVLDLREDTPKNRKWVKAWAKSFDDWTDRVSGEPVDAWDEIEGGRLFDYEGDWSSERWRDLQAAAGEDYDVLIAPDSLGGETRPSFIALRGESQIKSATGNNGQFDPTNPDIRFSPPRFFSQLATSIDQIPKKMETMPAAQWRMWLNGNAPKLGIKKDEIVWSGIDDYLALRGKDKVTKAEVQQFLSENGTQVNDVVLGGEDVGKYSVDQDPEDGVWRVANSETDEIVDAFDTENEALEAMRGYNVEQGNTKFGQYVVQGGENYRELLITLPEKTEEMKYPEPLVELPKEYVVIEDSSQPEDRRFGVIRDDQANARPAFGRWPTETAAVEEALRMLNYKQNTEYSDGWRARNETGKFKSSHFDQPNIIAHLRMDERTDAQGDKVLFLEEIQSDWGQKGKKEGFAGVTNVQPVAVKKSTGNQETVAEFDSAEAAQAYIAEHPDERLVTWKLPPGGKRGVPAAPFVTDTKSWVALGLKRAIMYAVQNGMSKVAWASGEQNAAHYDLSKQVDEISFLHNPDGTYKIAASNSGSSVLNENNVSIDRIEALVGKDIAKKVEENDGAPIGSSRNFDEATKPQGVRELAKDVFGGEMESLMSLDHVDGGVLPSLKHDQVVNAVIKAIPVDVVNIFSAANISPKDLFSNKDVVTLRLPVDSRSRAADGILSALRLTHATIRTKLSGVLSGGPNVELLPALFASDLNAREVASVVSPSTIFHGGASLSFPNGSASARSGAEPSGINNSIKLDPTTLADFLNRHDALIQKENKRILPQKYISPTSYAIRGSGLRVEAAGMKAFYDEIVPSVANDVLKKLGGGKVETFKINTKGADSDFPDFAKAGVMGAVRTDQMGFTIPPSMAEKVQTEGVPLFSTPRAIPSKDLAIVPVSSFSYNQDSDNYYYHVTSSPNADKALKSGLHPNKKAMFGAYQNYSKGKIFLTERDGVMFWIARVEDQLFDRYDDPPEVAVLRVLKSKLSSVEPDDVGTQDAKHPAVKYSTTRYEVKRDEEDEGTFAVALSNDQKNRNGDPLQVAHLHVPDEAVSAAGWRIGDIQVTKALRRQGIASELVRRMSEHLGSQPIGAASVFSEDGKKFFEGRTRYSTARAQTETPEFKKWFGDSKVVDADGKPLVVYHGTRTDFNEFKEGEGISTDGGYLGAGFYFTPSTDLAGQYGRSESGANVMPVYLSLKNPLIFNGSKEIELLTELGGGPRPLDMLKEAAATSVWAKKVRAGLESLGYDGIMDSSIAEYATEIVVFKPTQIKSAIGNNGQFDAKNPDIRRSTARGAITNQPINQSWQDPDSLGKWDDFVRTMQDKLVDTKRVITAIRAAGVAIKDTIDPYLQEVLYHGRAAKRVSDFADTELRPMLVEMGVRKIERQELEDYLWARHATERNTQIAKINPKMPDGGSGLTNQQAADILSGQTVNIGGRDIKLNLRQMPGYRSLAAKIDAITKETTDTLVRYGLETQDTVDAWRTTYGKYVPLMRDMEADDNYSGAFNLGLGTGQGFSVRGSASKRALGSERGVIDILANVAMQRERAIVRGEKNRVAQSMYGLAITAPNPDFWLPLNPDAKKSPAQVTAELVALGLNPIDAANIANEPKQRYTDPNTGMVMERVNPQLRTRGDVLAVRINGKDRYVMFSSNDRAQKMVAGLKNLDVDQLGMVMQKMAVVTRWFAAINTQYNPVFGLTNGIRDLGTGMLNLTSTELKGHQAEVFKNAFSALRGVYADLRDHRAGRTPTSMWAMEFEEFALEGGQTGYRDMFQTSRDRTDGLMQELKDATKGKTLLTFSEKRSPLFGWLSDYNTSIENAIRLSAYKAAKDNGMTKAQAASLAKNLTVNFNKKGLAATQLGAMYAFFNAAAQGTARIGQTLVKVDNGKFSLTGAGKKIVYGGMMAGVLQAAMFAAAGYDDEEPPQFIREKNFIIPLPDGKYLSVPYPLGFHVIPNIGRVASEFVLGGFKNPGKRLVDMFSMIMDGFNPIGGSSGGVSQMLSPTVTDPLVALSENKDWTGKSIYKEDFNSMHPTAGWTRKKDTASDLSRWMAYGINYLTGGGKYEIGLLSPTPDQLDFLIGQGTGGVGRESLKAWQFGSTVATGENMPMYKVPIAGRFVGETTGQASETSKFYNNLKRIGEHKAALDEMQKARDLSAMIEYRKENPDASLVKQADKASTDISDLKRRKRELLENGASPEQIRMMEEMITTRVRSYNERLSARS